MESFCGECVFQRKSRLNSWSDTLGLFCIHHREIPKLSAKIIKHLDSHFVSHLLKPSMCRAVWFPCGRFSWNPLFALLSLSHILTITEESVSGGPGGAEMQKDKLEAKRILAMTFNFVETKLFFPVTPRSWSCAFPVTLMVNFHCIDHREPFHCYLTLTDQDQKY